MIPTKTYLLSAIMGEEMTDKERIAELEAEVTMRREQAEGLQNQWVKDTQKIVALETDVKDLHADIARLTNEAYEREKDAARYRWLREKHWHDGGLCVVTNAADDGMVRVPVEPTNAMKEAGVKALHGDAVYKNVSTNGCFALEADIKDAYKAMIEAAKGAK